LFIAELAIDDADDLGVAKLAILVASAVSAVTSLAILRRRA
jgi:Na+/H+ antiporter NhaA